MASELLSYKRLFAAAVAVVPPTIQQLYRDKYGQRYSNHAYQAWNRQHRNNLRIPGIVPEIAVTN